MPEYNLGAMENPGCVTFREEYVFRGGSPRRSTRPGPNTILHEMAHMWFGDLVTMRWWDDLWLKESFADFMGALAIVGGHPVHRRAGSPSPTAARPGPTAQDQLPSTHPIVADIRDLEAAKLNFDGITYAKGASVLKQLVAYVGRTRSWRRAPLLPRHAFANTSLRTSLRSSRRPRGGTWTPGPMPG